MRTEGPPPPPPAGGLLAPPPSAPPPLAPPPLAPPAPSFGTQPPPPVGPPSAPEASTGRTVAVVVVAGLVAVVGVFVVLVGAVTLLGGRAATWDPALAPYVEFVERERGLEFEHPVDVRWASVADVVAAGEFADEETSWAEPFQIVGLLPAELDVAAAQGDVFAEHAAAFYDPSTEEIVLPPGEASLLDAATIVHELTHALQHQHGLLGPEWVATDNEWAGGRALVEGDADRVERAWYESLSARDQAKFDAELEDLLADVPDPGSSWLESSFYEPYALGDPAAMLILERWGSAELDDRLARGADSTEFLLDPFAPTGTDDFDTDGLPTSARTYDGWGSFGPVTWFQILVPTVGTETALDAVLGYGWDEYQRLELDGDACSEVTYWTDTPADRAEFLAALDAVADRYGTLDGIIEGDDGRSLRFDVCGPITDPAAQGPDSIEPLVVLAWVSVELSIAEYPDEQTRCIAPRVASAYVPDDDPTVDPWIQLGRLVQRFGATCG